MYIELRRPDGTTFRALGDHKQIASLQGKLEPGYSVVGRVLFCDAEGKGGFVSPVNGQSLMGALLEAHGDELLAWIKARLNNTNAVKDAA
jgi:hypothetical protein